MTGDPLRAGRRARRSPTGSTARASTAPTDPSQPFGNAERNTVRGPMFWQLDLAASKRFALGGPAQFEFRLEAFNLLNRTNFRAPNGNRSAAALRHDHGDLRSAAAPARVQAAVVSALVARRPGCGASRRRARRPAAAPPRPLIIAPPRRQRPSSRAHARGLPARGRDGRRLHRARSRLDEGRRADRPPRERDRRHHRRRRAVSRSQARPRRSTASRSPAGSPRTSRSPRSRRCARASGCRSARTPTTASFEIPTFDEVIALAQQLGADARAARSASIPRPSIRPTSAASACRSRSRCSRRCEKHGWNRRDAPVFIQSFEPGNLRELRKKTTVRLVQLVEQRGAARR